MDSWLRTVHRGTFFQFLFRFHISKSTGKETGKTHLHVLTFNFWSTENNDLIPNYDIKKQLFQAPNLVFRKIGQALKKEVEEISVLVYWRVST